MIILLQKLVIIVFVFLLVGISALSNNTFNALDENKDSTFGNFVKKYTVDELISDKTSREEILSKNQQIQKRNIVVSELQNEIQAAENILKKGIDYAYEINEINTIIQLREMAMNSMHQDDNKYLTERNLVATSILLNEIQNRNEKQLIKIKNGSSAISGIQRKIDSLAIQPELYIIPEDSIFKDIYFERYHSLSGEFSLVSKKLKNAIDSIQLLEIQSNKLKFLLESDISEIAEEQKIIQDNLISGTDKGLFTSQSKVSFIKSVLYSGLKNILLLIFYFLNHKISLLLVILFILAIATYLNILRKKYINLSIYKELNNPVTVLEHPIAVSIILTLTFYQFLLPLPPFIITAVFWLISAVALNFVFSKTLSKTLHRTWISFFIISSVSIIDNLILVQTVTESIIILIISISGILVGINLILKRSELGSKFMIWIIIAMISFEALGLLFLVTGNYNVGKSYINTGILTILTGYLIFNAYRYFRSVIRFSENLKEIDEVKNIQEIIEANKKVTRFSYVLYVTAWYVLMNRTSYFFQSHAEPFKEMITQQRSLGTFSFTYEGILIFFLIIFVSAIIARVVSFLTTDPVTNIKGIKKSGLGSWLLLIRISIITTGIIIAFVSIGIKVDRLVMIISALGVGIGFGLQTLVNNLIGGLIIAFEKPVNLNDIVEIGGQTGKVKSIGIRSSVVTTFDGADVVIPNGDLLNQFLVNWTMGNSRRRFEIKVGVAYGTDLKTVKSLIEQVLKLNKNVLKSPEPDIWVTTFSDSSIDISIKFWVSHFNYGFDIKSNLMIEINEVFHENGIVIPFPQQDVYLKSEIKSDQSFKQNL